MFKYYVIHNLEEYRKERITTQLQENGVEMDDVKFVNYPNKKEKNKKVKDVSSDKASDFLKKYAKKNRRK